MTTKLKYWEFSKEGFRYQILERPLGELSLYFKWGEGTWEFGHRRAIPAGRTAADVAEVMRRYVLGDLTVDEYRDWFDKASEAQA